MMVKKSMTRFASVMLIMIFLLTATSFNTFAEGEGVVINEVESNDPEGGSDWIELYNYSAADVNISGWIISDDKGLARLDDHSTTPIPDNTVIKAGEFMVFEVGSPPYEFGLGKNDAVNLYDENKNLVDTVAYTGHANTLGRFPDGTGYFVETFSTKGRANSIGHLRINEIETKHDVFEDYVEIINIGDQPVDISGWYVMDNDPAGHAAQVIPVPEGTFIEPGQLYVFDTGSHFTFGIGKSDTITLRNPAGLIADEYTWTKHPAGTWSRVPDGTGDLIDYPNSKGVFNKVIDQDIVINEIESNGSDHDWVEIYNNSDNEINISGWYIKDDSDDHTSEKLEAGTILPAKGYFVFEDHFDFGLGSSDKVRLYNADNELIDEHTWTNHAVFGLSRIPNGVGGFKDVPLTKGSENIDAEAPTPDMEVLKTLKWPGPPTIEFLDEFQMFKEDSSGLEYHDGALWLVDNGTGTIWKLDLDEQGIPSFAEGFENGKIVKFKKDKGVVAPGPDAEGLTLDSEGMLYIASERDNAAKGTNLNVILQVNPDEETNELDAIREWDITDIIDQARQDRGVEFYQVKSNMGIEAIEWIPNAVLEGKLFDQNKNALYNPSDYSSVNDGLFFIGLEDDGFIYVFALSEDEKAVLVTQINTRMGMVMGLNYDELTDELWAQTDNGRMNILARISLNATENVDIIYYDPPQELDTSKNNEGFAIAPINVGGRRPVYWVEDGIKVNSLKMGYIETYQFPVVVQVYDLIDQPIDRNYIRIYFVPTDDGSLSYNPSFDAGVSIAFDVLKGTTWGEALANGFAIPTATPANDEYVFDRWDPALPSDDLVLANSANRYYSFTAVYKLAAGATTDDPPVDDVPATGETPIIMFAIFSFIFSGVILSIRKKVDRVR